MLSPRDCDTRRKVERGKYILVHAETTVDESSENGEVGKLIDSTEGRIPTPMRFQDGDVIEGWLIALDGVCEGSTVTFAVPPELGYVNAPENAKERITFRFVVEILQVSDTPIEQESLFDHIDTDKDGLISAQEFEDYFDKVKDHEGEGAPWLLFLREDLNKDGVLTWDEFQGPKGTAAPAVAVEAAKKQATAPPLGTTGIDGSNLVQKEGGVPIDLRFKDLAKQRAAAMKAGAAQAEAEAAAAAEEDPSAKKKRGKFEQVERPSREEL